MEIIVIITFCSLLSVGSIWLAKVIGAPVYFAKFLCILFAFICAYFLAETVVPESNRPWGTYLITIIFGFTFGFLGIGFISDDKKN